MPGKPTLKKSAVSPRHFKKRPSVSDFQALVYNRANSNHRIFPWRPPALSIASDGVVNPYAILVSEIMLQQTQTERVIEKFTQFINRFPTIRDLAQASTAEVLGLWQGLGYNRRGKALHEAAKKIVSEYQGSVPQDLPTLMSLPGIGLYTASAIGVFAYNKPQVMVETNIRTVFFYHFFKTELVNISDTELLLLIETYQDTTDPRRWYAALMDYGATLKAAGIKLNPQSKHYTKQSKFKGSNREIRGALLREILKTPRTRPQLLPSGLSNN